MGNDKKCDRCLKLFSIKVRSVKYCPECREIKNHEKYVKDSKRNNDLPDIYSSGPFKMF